MRKLFGAGHRPDLLHPVDFERIALLPRDIESVGTIVVVTPEEAALHDER